MPTPAQITIMKAAKPIIFMFTFLPLHFLAGNKTMWLYNYTVKKGV
jgi:hypothetical protein